MHKLIAIIAILAISGCQKTYVKYIQVGEPIYVPGEEIRTIDTLYGNGSGEEFLYIRYRYVNEKK